MSYAFSLEACSRQSWYWATDIYELIPLTFINLLLFDISKPIAYKCVNLLVNKNPRFNAIEKINIKADIITHNLFPP